MARLWQHKDLAGAVSTLRACPPPSPFPHPLRVGRTNYLHRNRDAKISRHSSQAASAEYTTRFVHLFPVGTVVGTDRGITSHVLEKRSTEPLS
jgi:hypothetical protein